MKPTGAAPPKRVVLFSLIATLAASCGAVPEEEEHLQLGSVEQKITYGGHDYLFVTTPKTWEQAQTYCSILGYHLVTIDDASEESFLNTQEAYRGLANWWIGYNDRGIEGWWVWTYGWSNYTNWYTPSNEPNDYQGMEDCATDRYHDDYERWNDWDCNLSFPFVCERESLPTSNRGGYYYSASNTASATINTYNFAVYLYATQLFTVGTCGVPGASGSGDTYLRINNPYGQEIAANDDSGDPCGLLSNLSIIAPVTGTYIIRSGCYGSGSCSGTVAFNY